MYKNFNIYLAILNLKKDKHAQLLYKIDNFINQMVQFLKNEHHRRRAIPLPAVGHSGQTLSGPTAHLVEALVILDRVLCGYPCINIHFSEK